MHHLKAVLPAGLALIAAVSAFADGTPVQWVGFDNNDLPEKVLIKGRTQTFNRHNYYAIKDGKIWFKPNEETTGIKAPWAPYSTGLPHSHKLGFKAPGRVVRLIADADELDAIGDNGVVYTIRLEKGVNWHTNTWYDKFWGFFPSNVLKLSDEQMKMRAMAIGRRNGDVLWFEDVDGNPHHWGGVQISTVYMLDKDGYDIHYTDPGIPADFSHRVCGPGRNRFVAENMSASASTMFIIDKSGRMFTKLEDFDQNGNDNLFIRYSYKHECRHDDGHNPLTDMTVYSLPPEDWRSQPAIPLFGKRQLTSDITILQDGLGNKARELRVAGRDENGNPGYFRKELFDDKWEFVPADIALNPEHVLKEEDIRNPQDPPPGPYHDETFTGALVDHKTGKRFPVKLSPFSASCSPSTLTVTDAGRSVSMPFHMVDVWTALVQNDPGYDGTPKLSYGTLEAPRKMPVGGANQPLADTIAAYFKKENLDTFNYVVESTQDYVRITSKAQPDLEMFLTREGRPLPPPKNPYLEAANAPGLTGDGQPFSAMTAWNLSTLIQKNIQALADMRADLAAKKKTADDLLDRNKAFKAVQEFSKLTQLNKIDLARNFEQGTGWDFKIYAQAYQRLYDTGAANLAAAQTVIEERIQALNAALQSRN